MEGNDPGRLHDWQFDAKTETDAAVVEEIYDSTGAVLTGKRMFDVGLEPWGGHPPFGMPVFVANSTAPNPRWRMPEPARPDRTVDGGDGY